MWSKWRPEVGMSRIVFQREWSDGWKITLIDARDDLDRKIFQM